MKIIYILIIIGVTSSSVSVNATTNQEQAQNCMKLHTTSSTSLFDAFQAGKCAGFINGWLQSIYSYEVLNSKRIFCVPSEVTNDQIQKIFIKWTEKHPENLHEAAISGLHQALIEAFPCTDPTPRK